VLEKPRRDVWILEVSSFQLETSSRFCPDVGVLLNILPNHLDRHGTMASYTRCKAKLFAACGAGATGLVPLEWLEPMQVQSGAQLRWQTFGTSAQATAWYRDGWIHLADGLKVDIRGTLYDHAVTGAAAAAALLALQAFGVDAGHAVDALRDMEPLPHRLQWAGQIGDIPCYNDSKATNLAALQAAVLRSPAPVRLIAGGLPKQKDFTSVQEVLAERVCSVYLIGKASEEMFAAWSDCVPCRRCGTLDQALQSAAKDAQKGECILLAPGCASFDQFCNYAERGEHFIQSIQCLAEKKQK
jgi:UDP-N-acetylmuramoylalanine--D-glutamate ligase